MLIQQSSPTTIDIKVDLPEAFAGNPCGFFVTNIELFVDEESIATLFPEDMDPLGDFTYAWDISGISDGTYTIKAVVELEDQGNITYGEDTATATIVAGHVLGITVPQDGNNVVSGQHSISIAVEFFVQGYSCKLFDAFSAQLNGAEAAINAIPVHPAPLRYVLVASGASINLFGTYDQCVSADGQWRMIYNGLRWVLYKSDHRWVLHKSDPRGEGRGYAYWQSYDLSSWTFIQERDAAGITIDSVTKISPPMMLYTGSVSTSNELDTGVYDLTIEATDGSEVVNDTVSIQLHSPGITLSLTDRVVNIGIDTLFGNLPDYYTISVNGSQVFRQDTVSSSLETYDLSGSSSTAIVEVSARWSSTYGSAYDTATITVGSGEVPSVSIVLPTDGSTVVQSDITIAASSSKTLSEVILRLDGVAIYQAYPSSTSHNHTITGFNWQAHGVGTHLLKLIAVDLEGNAATVTHNITVALPQAPKVTIVDPREYTYIVAPGESTSFSASVLAEGATKIEIFIDGVKVAESAEIPPAGTWVLPVTAALDDGRHSLSAIGYFGGGAASDTTWIQVNADLIEAPVVLITSPAAAESYSNTIYGVAGPEIEFTVTVDSGSIYDIEVFVGNLPIGSLLGGEVTGTGAYTVSVHNSWPIGWQQLSVIATDSKGQTGSDAVLIFVENGTAVNSNPQVEITAPTAGETISSSVTVRADAYDTASTLSGIKSVSFYVDGVLIGTDTTAEGTEYSVLLDLNGMQNGAHTIEAIAESLNGAYATDSITVTVSGASDARPTVMIVSPASGALLTGDTAVYAVAADDSAVANVRFFVDGTLVSTALQPLGGYYRAIITISSLSDGSHVLQAIAEDENGNTGAHTVSFYKGSLVTAPSVNIISPLNGAELDADDTVIAVASATVSEVRFYVDGTIIGTDDTATDLQFSAELDISNFSAGYHTITAIAEDEDGYISANSIGVFIDRGAANNPPSVSISSHADGATVSGTVNITASATDDDGIRYVDLYLDNRLIERVTTPSGSDYESSLNTRLFTNAAHILRAVAKDTHGQSSSDSITLNIDNVTVAGDDPPTISITSHEDGDVLSTGTEITATATDDNGIETVDVYVDSCKMGVAVLSEGAYSFTIYQEQLLYGIHTITFVAIDTVGQSSSDSIVCVMNENIADLPPVVRIIRPAHKSAVGTIVVIEAEAYDNAPLGSIQVLVDGAQVHSESISSQFHALSYSHAFERTGYHVIEVVATEGNTQSGSAMVIVYCYSTSEFSDEESDYFSVSAVSESGESLYLPEKIGVPLSLVPDAMRSTAVHVGNEGVEFTGRAPTVMADGITPVAGITQYMLHKRMATNINDLWQIVDTALVPHLYDSALDGAVYEYDCKPLLARQSIDEPMYDSLRSSINYSATALSGSLNISEDTFISSINIGTNYSSLNYLLVSKEPRGGGNREHWALLRVPVSSLEEEFDEGALYRTIVSSKLRIYINGASDGESVLEIYAIDPFTENTVTFSDIDISASVPVLVQAITKDDEYVDIEIRDSVQSSTNSLEDLYLLIKMQEDGWVSFKSAESSTNSPQVTIVTALSSAPAAPTNLRAQDLSAPNSYKVKLSWDDSTSDNVRCYGIYRSDDFNTAELIGTTVLSEYTDTSISSDGEYIYQVKSIGTAHHEVNNKVVVSCISGSSNKVLVGFHELKTASAAVSQDTVVSSLLPNANLNTALLTLSENEFILVDADLGTEPVLTEPDIRSIEMRATPAEASGGAWIKIYDIQEAWNEETATYNSAYNKSELRSEVWVDLEDGIFSLDPLLKQAESGLGHGIIIESSTDAVYHSSESVAPPYFIVKYSHVDNSPDLERYGDTSLPLLHTNGLMDISRQVGALSTPAHIAHAVFVENSVRNQLLPQDLPAPQSVSNPITQADYDAIKAPADGNGFSLQCRNTADIPCLMVCIDVNGSLPQNSPAEDPEEFYPQEANALLGLPVQKPIHEVVAGLRVMWRGHVEAADGTDGKENIARIVVWNNTDLQWMSLPQDSYNTSDNSQSVYLHITEDVHDMIDNSGFMYVMVYPNRCDQRIDLALVSDYVGVAVEVYRRSNFGTITVSGDSDSVYIGLNSGAFSVGEISQELSVAEILSESAFTTEPSMALRASSADGSFVKTTYAAHPDYPLHIGVINLEETVEEDVTIKWEAWGR